MLGSMSKKIWELINSEMRIIYTFWSSKILFFLPGFTITCLLVLLIKISISSFNQHLYPIEIWRSCWCWRIHIAHALACNFEEVSSSKLPVKDKSNWCHVTTFKCNIALLHSSALLLSIFALAIYVRSLELACLYFKFEPYNDALWSITLLYVEQWRT